MNCNLPLYPTKVGPTLRCIKAKYLRSISGKIPAIKVKFISIITFIAIFTRSNIILHYLYTSKYTSRLIHEY